jgi:hypothetical protein
VQDRDERPRRSQGSIRRFGWRANRQVASACETGIGWRWLALKLLIIDFNNVAIENN